jgi:hypothetical protein
MYQHNVNIIRQACAQAGISLVNKNRGSVTTRN